MNKEITIMTAAFAQAPLRQPSHTAARRSRACASVSGNARSGLLPAVREGCLMDGMLALYIFMLAAFTGYEIIGKVPVILHTPLMSGSNFVHGVVVVGAMVVLGQAETPVQQVIGFFAVALGAANAAGGYVVTERMLGMFKKKED
jgi:NAD(P) transhydrogenase subunit alpha